MELMRLLRCKGIGIEAGVWKVAAADILQTSGLADDCLRILIEAPEDEPEVTLANASAVEAALNRPVFGCPGYSTVLMTRPGSC